MFEDDYPEIYKLDAEYEWLNSAYDEMGNHTFCDICGEAMKFNPVDGNWYCPECEREMSRAEYLDSIGACVPGQQCITNCDENYPICKRSCPHYEIDENDPIMK